MRKIVYIGWNGYVNPTLSLFYRLMDQVDEFYHQMLQIFDEIYSNGKKFIGKLHNSD